MDERDIDNKLKCVLLNLKVSVQILDAELSIPKGNAWIDQYRRTIASIEDALCKMDRPGSLLELGLQSVEELGLPLEDLPHTLREKVKDWPRTRGQLREEKRRLIRTAFNGCIVLASCAVTSFMGNGLYVLDQFICTLYVLDQSWGVG